MQWPRGIVRRTLLALAVSLCALGAIFTARRFRDAPALLITVRWRNRNVAASVRPYTPWTERYNRWRHDRWTEAPRAAARVTAVRQLWERRLPKGVFGGTSLSGESVFVGCAAMVLSHACEELRLGNI